MAPVRDRYKIFIIDEVHRLSAQAVQRAARDHRGAAAARRLHDGDDRADKVPPTIQSRSQAFELKTIGVKQIAEQLKSIAAAEQIAGWR